MSWLARNAAAIEAGAALVTATVAVAAVVGIKVQLDAADRLAVAQSARDAYRGHLALAVSAPAFAAPEDPCAVAASEAAGAYDAFIDHLLYSAELTLEIADDWDRVFIEQLRPHAPYICVAGLGSDYTRPVLDLLDVFDAEVCPGVVTCPTDD